MKLLGALFVISLIAGNGYRSGQTAPRERGWWMASGIFVPLVGSLAAWWSGEGDAMYVTLTMLSAGIAYGLLAEYGARKATTDRRAPQG